MLKYHLLLIAVLIGSAYTFADQSTARPQHHKKAYLDPVQNKLFWPLEKPVWIRLAESADKAAPSYLLTRDNDSSGINSGFKLDMSGSQFIRWKNFLTGDSVKLRFIADGEPPECAMSVAGEKAASRPTDTSDAADVQQDIASRPVSCYAKKVTVTFSGKDRLSGLDTIFYSVNEGPFQPAVEPVIFDKEARYRVAFYATDKVGNSSSPDIRNFSIDATPPRTVLAFNGRTNEGDSLFSRSRTFSLTGIDTISGARETWYRFDSEKKYSTYKKPVSLKDLGDGKHTVHFYSVDNAGNEEKPVSRTFTIDDTPPVPVISFEGDRFAPAGGLEYISPRTVVKITASDNKSGIEKIEYAIENADFVRYSSPFRFSPQLKKCAIEVRVTDNAGNMSRKYDAAARMDAVPPRSGYSITGPLHQKSGIAYLTSESRITLSSQDEGSGVASLHYRVNEDAAISYVQPVSLAKEGRHLFKFWGIDKVNNAEDTQAVVMVIDNTAPTIIETFSVQLPASDAAGKSLPKYPLNTALFLAASDASGVDGIWYSVNGKKDAKYTGNLQFDQAGSYTVVIRAKDILGKIGEKTLRFEIAN